jgi:hypothetical protein
MWETYKLVGAEYDGRGCGPRKRSYRASVTAFIVVDALDVLLDTFNVILIMDIANLKFSIPPGHMSDAPTRSFVSAWTMNK